MKKLLVLIIALGSMLTTQAQVSIGFRAGLNTTADGVIYNGILNPFNGNMKGWSATIPVRIQLSKNFSLQPELSFIEKKSSYDFTYANTTFKSTSYSNYLELPVLASFGLLQKEGFSLNVFVGPSISYILDDGGDISVVDQMEVNQATIEVFESYCPPHAWTNWGYRGIVGTNVLFNVKDNLFSFDIRYSYEYSSMVNYLSNSYQQSLDISVGYIYPLK